VFGVVENGVMVLNDCGKMVQQTWNEMFEHFSGVEIDEFVVMPDHIHAIMKINNANSPDVPISLPNLVYYLKTRTTNKYIDGVRTLNWQPFNKRLWQRNYWEHVIRDEMEYARIARYIRRNPKVWRKNRLAGGLSVYA
jgi:REP element-mobilizing transposase RayT